MSFSGFTLSCVLLLWCSSLVPSEASSWFLYGKQKEDCMTENMWKANIWTFSYLNFRRYLSSVKTCDELKIIICFCPQFKYVSFTYSPPCLSILCRLITNTRKVVSRRCMLFQQMFDSRIGDFSDLNFICLVWGAAWKPAGLFSQLMWRHYGVKRQPGR